MARTQQKDLLTRLADAGEDAIARLADVPGGQRFVEATHNLRERLDELQRRVRSLDPLERRVTELERRLEALESKPRGSTTAAAPGATPGARRAGAAVAKSGAARKSGSASKSG